MNVVERIDTDGRATETYSGRVTCVRSNRRLVYDLGNTERVFRFRELRRPEYTYNGGREVCGPGNGFRYRRFRKYPRSRGTSPEFSSPDRPITFTRRLFVPSRVSPTGVRWRQKSLGRPPNYEYGRTFTARITYGTYRNYVRFPLTRIRTDSSVRATACDTRFVANN